MTLINMLQTYRPNTLKGQYVSAYVVNNNDPSQKQRIKARASQLFLNCPDDQLPWARPIAQIGQGNSSQMNSVNIPANGSAVWLFIPDDDLTNLYYGGNDSAVCPVPPEFATNYPNAYGCIDQAGNLFMVDTVAGTWTLNLAGGTVITINGSEASIAIEGILNMFATGDVNIGAGGSMTIAAASSLSIGAPTVTLGGTVAGEVSGTAATPPSVPTLSTAARSAPALNDFSNQLTY